VDLYNFLFVFSLFCVIIKDKHKDSEDLSVKLFTFILTIIVDALYRISIKERVLTRDNFAADKI